MAEEREIVVTHVQVGPYVAGRMFKVEPTASTTIVAQEKQNTQFTSQEDLRPRTHLSLALRFM